MLLGLSFLWMQSYCQEQKGNPKIIKTIPEYGDCSVDSDLSEVVILFDQDMHTGMSVLDSRDMPKLTDRPYWKDKRTFIIPVELTADKLYHLVFNSQQYSNFRNLIGQPLQPEDLIFKTKSADFAELNAAAYNELFNYFPDHYSYADQKNIDWEKEFKQQKDMLINSSSNVEFAITLLSILKKAQDMHLSIEVKGQKFYPKRREIINPNYVRSNSISKMLDDKRFSEGFKLVGGRIEDVGYISVKGWNFEIDNLSLRCWLQPDSTITIGEFFEEMCALDNLIIDVRENTGGNELYAKQFAAYFTNDTLAYEKIVLRNAETGLFDNEQLKYLYPNKESLNYKGNIYVLSGPNVMSSNESFLLMMQQMDNVKIAGMTSYGSTGNPIPYELSNHIKLFIPSWKAYTLEGELIEGKGIKPDIEIYSAENHAITRESLANDQEDTLLKEVIELTKQ